MSDSSVPFISIAAIKFKYVGRGNLVSLRRLVRLFSLPPPKTLSALRSQSIDRKGKQAALIGLTG